MDGAAALRGLHRPLFPNQLSQTTSGEWPLKWVDTCRIISAAWAIFDGKMGTCHLYLDDSQEIKQKKQGN